MHLINQQPMDTLPQSGEVFVQYYDHEYEVHRVLVIDVDDPLGVLDKRFEPIAWSYEASTREQV